MSETPAPYRVESKPCDLSDLLEQLGDDRPHVAHALGVSPALLQSWVDGHVPVPKMAILALRHLVTGKLQGTGRLVDLRFGATTLD